MTREQLKEAIWQAFYHCRLDDFAKAIVEDKITGNDHPTLDEATDAIFRELPQEGGAE